MEPIYLEACNDPPKAGCNCWLCDLKRQAIDRESDRRILAMRQHRQQILDDSLEERQAMLNECDSDYQDAVDEYIKEHQPQVWENKE
jgi:uncharacterized protein YeeX (DUF496 family)